ncbi:MAG: hypothetical protein K2X69_09250 [Silvanigrellaceae bacterium]|nr:hypothetical protein [Silvanigrellaceae bacterium]
MTKMNLTQFAKKIKKDPSYINRLKKQGRFKGAITKDPVTGKDLIDFEKGFKLFNGESISHEKKNASKVTTENMEMDYSEAKCMKISYEALQERIKYEKEIGKLIEAESVEKEATRTGLILRERILAVATSVSPFLVGLTSEFEIKNKILEFLNAALNQLYKENISDAEEEAD